MDADYRQNLARYRTAMSMAEDMLSQGIINARDYWKIEKIIAKKYSLTLSSICCRNPLIASDIRVNMTPNHGGDASGTEN